MKYLKFAYNGKVSDLVSLDKRRELLAEAGRVDSENDRLYREALNMRQQMVDMAARIWKKKPYLPQVEKPQNQVKVFRKLERKYWQWQEREDARQKAREYRQRSKETTAMLEEQGFVPGEHFSPTAAITFAKKALVETEDGELVRTLPAPGDVHEREY